MMTRRKKQFIEELYVDFNETQAAIRAGYSKRSARQIGSRLMTDDDVKEGIKKKDKELVAHIKANQIRTIREIERCAFFDIANIFDDDGNLLNINDIPIDTRAAISSIRVARRTGCDGETFSVIEIRTNSKMDALEKLAKIQGIFNDVNLNPDGETRGIMYYPQKVEVGAPVDMKLLEESRNDDKED